MTYEEEERFAERNDPAVYDDRPCPRCVWLPATLEAPAEFHPCSAHAKEED